MNGTATLSKWGNGQGLRIPKVVCEQLGITTGDNVSYSVTTDGSLLITPLEGRHYRRRRIVTIEELSEGWTGERVGEEWGGPDVGAEIVE